MFLDSNRPGRQLPLAAEQTFRCNIEFKGVRGNARVVLRGKDKTELV